MVFGLITILAVLIFLAFFIGKNLDFTCSLWIFKTFENKPVSMIVLASFAAGICFALLFIAFFKLKKAVNSESDTEEIKQQVHKKRILLKKVKNDGEE